MANQQQVALLSKGIDEWNAWRREHPSDPIDLVSADLRDQVLVGVNFENADLSEAELAGANLSGANLQSATLVNADLSGLRARPPVLGTAKGLMNLEFHGVLKLETFGASLTHANIDGADFTDAIARRVNLSGANLRDAKGIRFDENEIQGTRFTAKPGRFRSHSVITYIRSPFALSPTDDPWSLLRRTYTGTRLVLTVLALFAFLLPRLLTTVGLFLLSEYPLLLSGIGIRLLDPSIARDPGVAAALGEPLPAAVTYDVWRVALGFDGIGLIGLAWNALILLLFVYNVFLFVIYGRVAPLRENEQRSAVTPALADYMPLYEIHRKIAPFKQIGLILLLFNVGRGFWWFFTTQITLLPQ